jgi:hypothetical protein
MTDDHWSDRYEGSEDEDEFDDIDFRYLLGEMSDYPQEPPTYAPDGYAVELDKIVKLLTDFWPERDFDGETVSQTIEYLLKGLK